MTVTAPPSQGENMSSPATNSVRCRPAIAADSSDLAILADAATRRLISWVWDSAAQLGQSSFEVGRNTIHSNVESLSHFTRWRVAERNGTVAGAINGYRLTPAQETDPRSDQEVLAPLNELKAIATDTWYVSVASVFPESRNEGIGRALLADAQQVAAEAGQTSVSLIVASFNPSAKRLYELIGFIEWERRPFRPFPGSDETGEWILMVQELPRR